MNPTFIVSGMIGLAALALSMPSFSAVLNSNIKVTLEEPTNAFPATGISTIRGWAVGPAGLVKTELYIDGVYKRDIPYGGARGDVCNTYPAYQACDRSGFAMAYNFNLLDQGNHTFKIRALAANGDYNEASQNVVVQSLHKPYINDANAMNLGGASFAAQGNDLVVRNARVDGQGYDLTMRWNLNTQAPELYAINSASTSNVLTVSGTWDMFSEMDASACGEGVDVAKQAMTLTQSGTTVTFNGEVSGTLNGSRLNLTENYSASGNVLVVNWVFDFAADTLFTSATGNWTWTSGSSSCKGTTKLIGKRRS